MTTDDHPQDSPTPNRGGAPPLNSNSVKHGAHTDPAKDRKRAFGKAGNDAKREAAAERRRQRNAVQRRMRKVLGELGVGDLEVARISAEVAGRLLYRFDRLHDEIEKKNPTMVSRDGSLIPSVPLEISTGKAVFDEFRKLLAMIPKDTGDGPLVFKVIDPDGLEIPAGFAGGPGATPEPTPTSITTDPVPVQAPETPPDTPAPEDGQPPSPAAERPTPAKDADDTMQSGEVEKGSKPRTAEPPERRGRHRQPPTSGAPAPPLGVLDGGHAASEDPRWRKHCQRRRFPW